MFIGLSQVDITPKPGVELAGFAARQQPSVGVLDPLFAKALYLVDGEQKLLWIHCDLLEIDRDIIVHFRKWAQANLKLMENQVTISVTHTHSGPAAARTFDASYVALLNRYLEEAARKAMAAMEECELVSVEGAIGLAQDRRRMASAHTDPRVAAVGFRRADGTYMAVLVNFAIHPVALGASNRFISADISGQIAGSLQRRLPGIPLVLVANGASGNLNPPAENVPFEQIVQWGREVADVVAPLLAHASPVSKAGLFVKSRIVPLPLDTLSVPEIHAAAAAALQLSIPVTEWGDIYRKAVREWEEAMVADTTNGGSCLYTDAELFAVRLGEVIFVGINGEVFSRFIDWLRGATGTCAYVVGYANGGFGYLPTLAAYSEGGYEVDIAHIFRGHFRVKPGGFELLADEAVKLIQEIPHIARLAPSKRELAGRTNTDHSEVCLEAPPAP